MVDVDENIIMDVEASRLFGRGKTDRASLACLG
ncbi:MAG: hypothetical protein ACI9CE_003508 [Flavobacterium sp.]|jgi:hypothetical protein